MKKLTLTEKIHRIGTLKDMGQAIRLITNMGHVVIGWNGLTVSVLDSGDIEFKETANGRIHVK